MQAPPRGPLAASCGRYPLLWVNLRELLHRKRRGALLPRNPPGRSGHPASNTLSFLVSDILDWMGSYFRGDVLLAPLCIAPGRGQKTRPVVVLGTRGRSDLVVSPVSGSPPFEGPVVPLSLTDFSEGGLALSGESYLLTTRICTIRAADVVGKKGRLSEEAIRDLLP